MKEPVTYEESQRLLRAPYLTGKVAKPYSGLKVGQEVQYRTYPNDPGYCEILTSRNGVPLLFTEVWDTIEGFDQDGNPLP